MKLNDDKESCYFYSPGKMNNCSILNQPCDPNKSRQLCKFHKTEYEYYLQRNKALELNRRKGNCAKCKYKQFPCELSQIEEDDVYY